MLLIMALQSRSKRERTEGIRGNQAESIEINGRCREKKGEKSSKHAEIEATCRVKGPARCLGSCGNSIAFALALSQAPASRFQPPAHQTVRAVFPHPAFS